MACDRLSDNCFNEKSYAKVSGPFTENSLTGATWIAPSPIQAPIKVMKNDIKKTLHKILIVICDRKLSFGCTIRSLSLPAGFCVRITKLTTASQINGNTLNVFCQTSKLKPNSNMLIKAAIKFTEINDTINKNKTNSR